MVSVVRRDEDGSLIPECNANIHNMSHHSDDAGRYSSVIFIQLGDLIDTRRVGVDGSRFRGGENGVFYGDLLW